MRSSPNSSGHGESPSSQRLASALECLELTPVPLELLALGRHDLRRGIRDEPLVREHRLAARDLLLQTLPFGVCAPPSFAATRSGLTTESKMRFSSPSSATSAPLLRKVAAALWTRSIAAAAAGSIATGSGHGPRIRRPSSWNCDQISSVTCGSTGWSSASRRSSAASAVEIAAGSSA